MESLTVDQYLTELASGAPTPGGGAAAALTAAQAAALLSMVLNVSCGSESKGSEERALLTELAGLRHSLLKAAEDDAQAFQKLMAAYSLPKETADQQNQRRATIELGLKGATAVPLDVMKGSARLLALAEPVIALGKASVISDAALGVILAVAALRSANYNVLINLKYLKDEAFRVQAGTEADRCLAAALAEKSLLDAVGKKL